MCFRVFIQHSTCLNVGDVAHKYGNYSSEYEQNILKEYFDSINWGRMTGKKAKIVRNVIPMTSTRFDIFLSGFIVVGEDSISEVPISFSVLSSFGWGRPRFQLRLPWDRVLIVSLRFPGYPKTPGD